MTQATHRTVRGRAARAYWLGLIAHAGRICAAPSAQAIEDFRHELSRSGRCPFPVEGASCLMAADGFLSFGRAYAIAPGTRREALAPALSAAAMALDGLLHAESAQLAARTWLKRDLED